MAALRPSQRYLSTRGGSYGLSFEEVVLKGLASDGGLFIPEEIPALPEGWEAEWKHLSFQELAFEIFSLYVSPDEIPPADLKDIIRRSYETFRHPEVTPVVTLDPERNIHLLELFHGPTFAFKDVALQFLGNLFEYFLVRRNEGKAGKDREHLTVIGATSGDTGSAAIYGLRGKKDVSVFIMHPKGKISPIQEAQMTTVLDANVHNIAVDGTFDDCQDIVKSLFGDPEINGTHRLAAVNSINWARILAQMTYYVSSYFHLTSCSCYHAGAEVRFVVPTGNFGDVLAGYFAKQMGLPVAKLVVSTNENDILHRFWQSGHYEKKAAHGEAAGGAPEDGVKETLSPAMDILVSSNFERLLWYLAFTVLNPSAPTSERRKSAGEHVKQWLGDLKSKGGFSVPPEILASASRDFESERVSDKDTLSTIAAVYSSPSPAATDPPVPAGMSPDAVTTGHRSPAGYILDPHTAVAVAASQRSVARHPAPGTHHIALSTAHPAKFSKAVEMALDGKSGFGGFEAVLPSQFVGLEERERRVTVARMRDGWQGVRRIVVEQVAAEKESVNGA